MHATARPLTVPPPRRPGTTERALEVRAATGAFALAVLLAGLGIASVLGPAAGAGSLLCLLAAFLCGGVGATLANV